MIRDVGNPKCEVEHTDDATTLTFWAPGSKFGAVRITLSRDEAERLGWRVITRSREFSSASDVA